MSLRHLVLMTQQHTYECDWVSHVCLMNVCYWDMCVTHVRLPCLLWVALVSRIDKIIGLFCKTGRWKRRYSAKETYNFIDPTDRSHPIVSLSWCCDTQSHSYVCSWLNSTHMSAIETHSETYMWHDSFICVLPWYSWLISRHVSDRLANVCYWDMRDSIALICVLMTQQHTYECDWNSHVCLTNVCYWDM